MTCISRYILTPRSRVRLVKLTGFQLVKKFPAFYETRRFITAFASDCHLSLSWASSIQSIPPPPTSWRSIVILSSHLRLCLPGGLLPSGFPTKILYMSVLAPIRATCHTHRILLDFITRKILGEERISRYFFKTLRFCILIHECLLHALYTERVILNILLHMYQILNEVSQISYWSIKHGTKAHNFL